MVNGIAKLLLQHAGLPLAARAGRASRPKGRRRERTPEERAEISKRMTAYWQRKREEKAASGN